MSTTVTLIALNDKSLIQKKFIQDIVKGITKSKEFALLEFDYEEKTAFFKYLAEQEGLEDFH